MLPALMIFYDRLTKLKTVNPRISVGGVEYILLTQLLAAIPVATLGPPVGSASSQREAIVAALDLLFTGI
jgi:toxin CcdB